MAHKSAKRTRKSILDRVITLLCVTIIILGAGCLTDEYLAMRAVRARNDMISQIYHDAAAKADASSDVREPVMIASADTGAATASPTTPPTALPPVTRTPRPTITPSPSPTPEATLTPTPEPALQPQFEELYARNSDLIGWISMAGDVDYPIVYRDNTFYMDHDFFGQPSRDGAIFLDARSDADMNGDYMVLYGHNMKSGAMFGNLDMFRMRDYLKSAPIITIQSAWEPVERKYVIFSLFDASMNKNFGSYIRIRRFPFESDQEKLEYYTQLKSRSFFNLPVSVLETDQVVGLVTCSYSEDNGRLLIFARRLRDNENEEDMKALFEAMG